MGTSLRLLGLQRYYDATLAFIDEVVGFHLDDIKAYQRDFLESMRLIIWSALGLLGVSLTLGLAIILNMKQEYLAEVYMLTFLDEQVLRDNKRLSSFIQKLEVGPGA